ncbi:MAG: hypothetical protein CL534_27210 [Ahrensia sp.]|nr:hypothetical protein [Ahrensia sp.]
MLSIRHFFAAPEKGWLFDIMVNKLGMRTALQSRANSEAVAKRAQARCAECDREDSCQNWLASNDKPDEAPYFCRNHDLLARLKHDTEVEATLQTA